LAFTVVTVIALGAMLGVNYAQTGDPLLLAYSRMDQYTVENLYRFNPLAKGFVHTQLSDPIHAISMGGVGLLRLRFSLFGFPCGIALAWLALGLPQARLAWLACLGFTLVHLPMTDAGIDTFGPVHWYEIALPILVLSVLALSRISEWSKQLATSSPLASSARALSPSLLIGDAQFALSLASFFFFLPGGYWLNVLRSMDLTQIWSTLVVAAGARAIDRRRSFGSAAAILFGIQLVFALVLARFLPS
jgi:hypothetical protein